MTDGNRFTEYNIKGFGNLSFERGNSYRYSMKQDEKEVLEYTPWCADRICLECGNDHTFRGNFDDDVTSIDMLPALFKESNRSNCKLEEFVN